MLTKPIHLIVLVAVSLSTCAGQTATLTTLYSFQGSPTDGQSPNGALLLIGNGTLYGTTTLGGPGSCGNGVGCGTVYQLKPPMVPGGTWEESIIYSFAGYPGAAGPGDGLVISNGTLYGTSGGGAYNAGAVFQLTPPIDARTSWTETLLWSASWPTSYGPLGPLVLGQGGTLHGTTSGAAGHTGNHQHEHIGGATVFVLTPPATAGETWTESPKYDFAPVAATGTNPRAGLVTAPGGLFGTLYYGGVGNELCGASGCGAVFEMGAESEAIIYQFNGPPIDGAHPIAALTAGQGGVLYGTTLYGGPSTLCVNGCGTIFQLTPPPTAGGTWTESVLYSFTGSHGDGAFPSANVVLGKNGSLYGTTQYGGSSTSGSPCSSNGASGCGTAFELTPPTTPGGSWTETVLYSFTGENGDGAIPEGPLLLSPSGVLYGTTYGGGTAGAGTVFSLALN